MLCALNEYGKITWNELQKTSEIRKNMKINCCVVMPNHIHAIMVIENPMTDVGAYCNTPLQSGNTPLQTATKFQSPSNNLGSMIRGYKSTVTKQINELRKTPGETIWQRNYHEHIIRNEKSYEKIYHYILHNPEKWEEDKFYVEN
jgi:REP element-mobilizing transposase RayT